MTTPIDESLLQLAFEELNHQFFQGRLPRYRVVYSQPPGDPRDCSGHCDPDSRTIYVEPSSPTPQGLRQILLHEMCHIGSLGHGKRFQAKLLRLAERGEPWAKEEAAAYADALARGGSLTARIAEEIRGMAWELSDCRWSEVERRLARELGYTVAELRRAAPWAARRWERDVSAVRQDRARQETLRQQLESKRPAAADTARSAWPITPTQ